ncbi:MAG: helix-turn-helix transcriptional regulator [Frankiales bacterium]|nr:helix-turn-helix transcriptional regulator [Frankiales bacterium]
MARRSRDTKELTQTQFTDEFGPYLDEAKRDPEFRAAFEDADSLQRIIDSLVKCRKALRLSQTDVAKRMGVRQPTVSGFETEASDPRLSTLQRYARAVEATLRVAVVVSSDCDWIYVAPVGGKADPCPEVQRSDLPERWIKAAADNNRLALGA